MDYIYIILAFYFINLFFGLKFLFSNNYNLSNMIYLFLIAIIFPLFTPIIYLMLFFNDNTRKNLIKKRKLDESIIPDVNNDELFNHNDITIYTNGKNLFSAIFDEIEKAEKFIHISFYTFKTDQISRQMISKLEEKLKQGIEVVLLYDKIGSREMKKNYFHIFKKLGGKVIPFMPLTNSFLLNLNYRNHRKTIVIDNKVSFIGGFNVGDEYLSRNKKMGIWVDSHMKVVGNATTQIEKRFLADYSYCTKTNINTKYYLISHTYTGNKKMQIISSGADVSAINQIENKFIEYIYLAKKCIYIQTPYLILNDPMIHALKYAAHKGVKIKIMIPNKKDHPFVLHATKSYARSLISKNISIYTFKKDAFLHSKVFICDDLILSLGTTNFDIRSFKYSLEINTFVFDKETNSQAKEIFEKQLSYCTLMTKEKPITLHVIKEDLCKLLSTIL